MLKDLFAIFDKDYQLISSNFNWYGNYSQHERSIIEAFVIVNELKHEIKIRDPVEKLNELSIDSFHDEVSNELNYIVKKVTTGSDKNEILSKFMNSLEIGHSEDPCIITSSDGSIITYNKSFTELFGYSSYELENLSISQLYADPSERIDITQEINKTGLIDSKEIKLKRKDGIFIYCLLFKKSIQDPSGNIIVNLVKFKDITHVKNLELDYLKLSNAIQYSSNIVVITDIKGIIEYVNPMFNKISGYESDDVIGKNINIINSGKQGRSLYEDLWETILQGNTWNGTFENIGKSGNHFFVSATIFPIKDEDGQIINFMAIEQDISDTIEAKKQIDTMQKLVYSIFENMPSGIVFLDKDYTIIEANNFISKIIGIELNDLKGTLFLDYIDDKYRMGLKEQIAQRSEGLSYFICKIKSNDEYKFVQISSQQISVESGSTVTVVINIEDLSEKMKSSINDKKFTQRLLQYSFLDAIGSLTSGLSHDFNNLLSSIIFNSHYLKKKYGTDPDLAELLDEILETANKGSELIKGFLSITKSSKIKFEPTDVVKLVKDLFSVIQRTFGTQIELKLHLPEEKSIFVMGSETALYNAILNLAINSKESIKETGIISISISKGQRNMTSHVTIKIEDTGIGIPKENFERIFEPYYSTKPNSSGLGLSIVKHTIHQHSGSIKIVNNENQGTIILIDLPTIEPPNKMSVRTQEKSNNIPKLKILLLDDELSINSSFARLIELEGSSVIHFENPLEAIEYYTMNSGTIDLVILDHNLPVMNGMQVLDHLIAIKKEVKTVIITGDLSLPEIPITDNILTVLKKPIEISSFWNIVKEEFGNGENIKR